MKLNELPLDELTAQSIWAALETDTRAEAARALYADKESRREADVAIAQALRFREVAVRKLSIDQRVQYMLKAVHPDESLATTLLVSLHLGERRALLENFLTSLEVPHDGGVIDAGHELSNFEEAQLTPAVAALDGQFDKPQVDLYLATLLAMDPEPWAELVPILRERG